MLPNITGSFRCVKDPELKFSQGGMPICTFTAVADKKKKDEASGQWVDDKVIFVRVTAFKGLAEHVAQSVVKGTTVLVQGQVSVSEWETQEGVKRSTVEITANEVGVSLFWDNARVEKAERSGGGQQAAPSQQASADPWGAPAAQEDAPPF